MKSRWFRVLLVGSMLCCGGGCDPASNLENPNQPKDLGPPWVNKRDTQMGMNSSGGDAKNHVFRCTTSTFGDLLEDIAATFNAQIAVKPKEMLDWNLTVEVKGANLEEVLADVAAKCRLTLGKSSSGLPLLTFPGKEASAEGLVKVDAGGEMEMDDE